MATVYTQAGENVIVDLIDGVSAVHLDATNGKIGWGTGAGTAAKGDTILFTEASEARVAIVASQPLTDKNQWVATLTANAAKTITNAGLFNAAAAGDLIVHGDFAGAGVSDALDIVIHMAQRLCRRR